MEIADIHIETIAAQLTTATVIGLPVHTQNVRPQLNGAIDMEDRQRAVLAIYQWYCHNLRAAQPALNIQQANEDGFDPQRMEEIMQGKHDAAGDWSPSL